MGLHVYVYSNKSFKDCAGVSRAFDRFTIANVPGPFEPCKDYPEMHLVPGPTGKPILVTPEYYKTRKSGWYVMGGNFASSHDSRFAGACCAIDPNWSGAPVEIHDRFETTS